MGARRTIALLLALSVFQAACTSVETTSFDPRNSSAIKAEPVAGEPEFTGGGGAVSPPRSMLIRPREDYVLGPGDKLDIEILGETGSRSQTFVTPDGRVYYDLLTGVVANGKSTHELKRDLEKQLTRYYRAPDVSVTLLEAKSQRVNVLGRLNDPGVYPLNSPMRVLDAISMAGGLYTSRFTGTTEELADLQHSFIVRDNEVLPVDFHRLIRDGDLNQNIYLRSGDFIYLPSALTNEVYVLGAVTAPRPVGFMNEMTLTAAIGRGLGLERNARLDNVVIVRGSLTDPKVATVNARAILNGCETNIRLEPGDIVYIPGSDTISGKQLAREAVNTFVRVVSANEGGNAGAGATNATPVGVNVNIGN